MRVLVLEAGRTDSRWDVFIHMPAALAFPIGSRFYDWRYESEPEPYMGGRRVYHARGKVLGGSSSINGMIFQRGNPLDYERWASDAGMETWDHAHCLPYFKRMENCLAAAPDDPFRGHSGPLVLERGPAQGPLFDAFFEAVQQAGYPLTDDVNGYRQEGFAAFDRNVHDGRRLSAARAYLHPVMKRPNLEVRTRAFVQAHPVRGRAGGRGRVRARARRALAREVLLCGGRDQLAAAAADLGRGGGRRAGLARGGRGARPARGRREPAGPPGGLRAAPGRAAGLDGALLRDATAARGGAGVAAAQERPGRDQPLRGGRVRARQRRGRLPEPDVPLPADRGALRRNAAAGRGRARLPGARRAHVLGRAREREGGVGRPAGEAGAPLQLPVDGQRPPRVDRGDPGDPQDPGAAGVGGTGRRRAVTGCRRWRPTRRS